jgi:hypothetical protein
MHNCKAHLTHPSVCTTVKGTNDVHPESYQLLRINNVQCQVSVFSGAEYPRRRFQPEVLPELSSSLSFALEHTSWGMYAMRQAP